MKKLLLSSLLLLLPMLVFADFQIGPTVLIKHPISSGSQILGKNGLSINDLGFGADARMNFSILQFSGLGIFTPGDTSISQPAEADINLDAGLCIDVLMFRFAAGLGPNFIFNFNTSGASQEVDGNIKFAVDYMATNIAVSLYYMIAANLTTSGVNNAFQKVKGQLGLSLLFKLF